MNLPTSSHISIHLHLHLHLHLPDPWDQYVPVGWISGPKSVNVKGMGSKCPGRQIRKRADDKG